MSKFPELDYLPLILPCISQKLFITSFLVKNITRATFNCNSLHQFLHQVRVTFAPCTVL